MKDTLLLRLKRKWFDAIAAGFKKAEYRKCTEYWRSRIEKQSHSSICFINGYGQMRPSLLVQYLGWDTQMVNGDLHYVLKLGNVMRMENYRLPAQLPSPASCAAVTHDETQLFFDPHVHMWLPVRCVSPMPLLPPPAAPLDSHLPKVSVLSEKIDDRKGVR